MNGLKRSFYFTNVIEDEPTKLDEATTHLNLDLMMKSDYIMDNTPEENYPLVGLYDRFEDKTGAFFQGEGDSKLNKLNIDEEHF